MSFEKYSIETDIASLVLVLVLLKQTSHCLSGISKGNNNRLGTCDFVRRGFWLVELRTERVSQPSLVRSYPPASVPDKFAITTKSSQV